MNVGETIMAKISVIVPIYNSEKHIKKCLDSIVNQSYKNIEIILVNDGSIDKSEEICKEYADNDKRIKYIFQLNNGVSSARNNGITNASGEYLLFVDSDDYIDLDMIEILTNNTLEEWDLIIFGFKEFCCINNTELILGSYVSSKRYDCKISDFMEIFGQMYELRLLSAPWNNLFSREIIENNNIRFIEEISYGEDTLFSLKYYNSCHKVCILDKTLYNYSRSSDESLSKKFNKDKYNTVNLIYDEIRNLLEKHGKYSECNKLVIERSYFYHIFITLEGAIGNLSYKKLLALHKDIVHNKNMLDAAKLLRKERNLSIHFLALLVRKQMSKSILLFLSVKTKIKGLME